MRDRANSIILAADIYRKEEQVCGGGEAGLWVWRGGCVGVERRVCVSGGGGGCISSVLTRILQ